MLVPPESSTIVFTVYIVAHELVFEIWFPVLICVLKIHEMMFMYKTLGLVLFLQGALAARQQPARRQIFNPYQPCLSCLRSTWTQGPGNDRSSAYCVLV